MKNILFFFILALASSCTATINSPAHVSGVMQSKKDPETCDYLLTYKAKRSNKLKEAWITGTCNEYLINDSLIHKVNSEIQVVRYLNEDRE